jgi:hypothetical protein
LQASKAPSAPFAEKACSEGYAAKVSRDLLALSQSSRRYVIVGEGTHLDVLRWMLCDAHLQNNDGPMSAGKEQSFCQARLSKPNTKAASLMRTHERICIQRAGILTARRDPEICAKATRLSRAPHQFSAHVYSYRGC